ncbi:hypothetical protein [Geodermatophilus sp. CPCC 206100]|uniref:hypothetical protein n=1 Tax=Geodermatophilus sp. CPCC 206100 TaxID=3020054 RepID=UPI003B0051EE
MPETIRTLVTRGARAALRICCGLLAVAGSLTAPGPSLLAGAALAGVVGVAVAVLARYPVDLPPLPHPAVAATGAGCLPAVVAGTASLGSAAVPAVGLLLTIGACRAARWLTSDLPEQDSSRWDEAAVRRTLRDLPTDLLLDEWRSSARPGRGDPAEELRRVRLRDLLLDEFQAREAAGTARWLAEAPGDPPDRYLGGDTSLGR